MLQGMVPFFSGRVKTLLKWSGKDANNPDDVRQTVIDVLHNVEAEQAGQGLHEELDNIK